MHSPVLGSEMTREPFRWDQRLFSLVLRFSGTPACERDIGHVPSDNSPIDSMCEVTGGKERKKKNRTPSNSRALFLYSNRTYFSLEIRSILQYNIASYAPTMHR